MAPTAAHCEITGGADQDRVLDLADGLEEPLRDDHPADSPTGEAVGLRERVQSEIVCCELPSMEPGEKCLAPS